MQEEEEEEGEKVFYMGPEIGCKQSREGSFPPLGDVRIILLYAGW